MIDGRRQTSTDMRMTKTMGEGAVGVEGTVSRLGLLGWTNTTRRKNGRYAIFVTNTSKYCILCGYFGVCAKCAKTNEQVIYGTLAFHVLNVLTPVDPS